MVEKPEKISWLWYKSRAEEGLRLDPFAYPRLKHITGQPVRTEWTCVQPNLVVHDDARIARVDAKVLPPPRAGRFQIGWMERRIKVLRRDWADGIADLVDGKRVAFGDISVDGKILPDWVTIHSAGDPPKLSEDCYLQICPNCGGTYTISWGKRDFFADPRAADLPLIVNGSGIFVREDEVKTRALPTPVGAYRPSKVMFRPDLGAKFWPPLDHVKPGGAGRHLELWEDGPPEGLDRLTWFTNIRRSFGLGRYRDR